SVTTERGFDVDELTLFAFGGAGPLHAAEVAQECGIQRILVPHEPGTMCARGALLSDISLDFVRTRLALATPDGWRDIWSALVDIAREGDAWLAGEKVDRANRHCHLAVDAHYRGQNYEITIQVGDLGEAGLDQFLER